MAGVSAGCDGQGVETAHSGDTINQNKNSKKRKGKKTQRDLKQHTTQFKQRVCAAVVKKRRREGFVAVGNCGSERLTSSTHCTQLGTLSTVPTCCQTHTMRPLLPPPAPARVLFHPFTLNVSTVFPRQKVETHRCNHRFTTNKSPPCSQPLKTPRTSPPTNNRRSFVSLDSIQHENMSNQFSLVKILSEWIQIAQFPTQPPTGSSVDMAEAKEKSAEEMAAEAAAADRELAKPMQIAEAAFLLTLPSDAAHDADAVKAQLLTDIQDRGEACLCLLSSPLTALPWPSLPVAVVSAV